MTTQFIKEGKKKIFAVIPYEEYMDMVEMLDDVAEIKAMKSEPEEEAFPADIVNRILEGEPTLKVFREYRDIKASELADLSGVAKQTISAIENNRRNLNYDQAKAIAPCLNLEIDDLLD